MTIFYTDNQWRGFEQPGKLDRGLSNIESLAYALEIGNPEVIKYVNNGGGFSHIEGLIPGVGFYYQWPGSWEVRDGKIYLSL